MRIGFEQRDGASPSLQHRFQPLSGAKPSGCGSFPADRITFRPPPPCGRVDSTAFPGISGPSALVRRSWHDPCVGGDGKPVAKSWNPPDVLATNQEMEETQ